MPGIHGATLLSEGFDLRYDDRRGGDFADSGMKLETWGAVVEGIAGSPTFLRGGAQANAIIPELGWLSGAGRAYWNAVSSAQAPFFAQSELGGSFLLRGFDNGRFVDRQAWTIDVEQRIRILHPRIFGVVADLRVDPFVTIGQVFGSFDSALVRPKAAVGLGFRVFVRSRLVGRIDVADGGEGLNTYVEVGYPY